VEQGIQEGLADYMSAEKRTATNVLAHVHGFLLEQNISGQKVPSIRTIRRRINKIDPYLLIRVKQGSIAASRAMRAGGRAHLSHMPMFCVQIDSHVCDVLVVDETTGDVIGRPILVLAIDVRTRCVVGWHLSMKPSRSIHFSRNLNNCSADSSSALALTAIADPLETSGSFELSGRFGGSSAARFCTRQSLPAQ